MVDGSIIVVAKCPLAGKSKTRLIPLLGAEGSATLATAMLSDILQNLATLKQSLTTTKYGTNHIDLILLYAPVEEEPTMKGILDNLQLSSFWTLLPMITGDLQSSHLGVKLTDALVQARKRQVQQQQRQGPVVFLGMDSPETPIDEIAAVFTNPQSLQSAILCPANDGGYGMLSVPPTTTTTTMTATTTEKVFAGVRWSHSLTALSQLKALTDAGIPVQLGRLMYDIDEPDDVHALVERLKMKAQKKKKRINDNQGPMEGDDEDDVLTQSSVGKGSERNADCPCTEKVLRAFQLL